MNTTPPKPVLPSGWVYFIRGGNFVKIGWSKKPDRRIEQLRTGCPFETKVVGRIPGTKKDESALHKAFAWAKARRKGEWFRAEPALLALVQWAANYEEAIGTSLIWADDYVKRTEQKLADVTARLAEAEARVETLEDSLQIQSNRLLWLRTAASGTSTVAWRGHDSALAAVRALVAEVNRAVDATDDHSGLAEVVTKAADDLARDTAQPLNDCFQGAAGIYQYLQWLEDHPAESPFTDDSSAPP